MACRPDASVEVPQPYVPASEHGSGASAGQQEKGVIDVCTTSSNLSSPCPQPCTGCPLVNGHGWVARHIGCPRLKGIRADMKLRRGELLQALSLRQGGKCAGCHRPLNEPLPKSRHSDAHYFAQEHIHHVLEVRNGGGNDLGNLQLMHGVCHVYEGRAFEIATPRWDSHWPEDAPWWVCFSAKWKTSYMTDEYAVDPGLPPWRIDGHRVALGPLTRSRILKHLA